MKLKIEYTDKKPMEFYQTSKHKIYKSQYWGFLYEEITRITAANSSLRNQRLILDGTEQFGYHFDDTIS